MKEPLNAIMEDEESSKLEELIHDLALRDRLSRDGMSSPQAPPPPIPPRPARRSAPAATPSVGFAGKFDPTGDLGLPLVNSSKRENYSKIVLNKRMWVSLKETDVECEKSG